MNMKAAVPALLAVLLGACVAANPPPRFEKETIAQIETGKSTRADVLISLGLPERTGPDGRIFYYTWLQSMAMVILPTTSGLFMFGSGSDAILRIDFDPEGVVRNVTPGEQTLSIPSGIQKATSYALALPEEDATAKRFLSIPDKCTIYLYVRRTGGDGFSSTNAAYLQFDRRGLGIIGSDTWYFRIRVKPGFHTAVILNSEWEKTPRIVAPIWGLDRKPPRIKEELTFRCNAGDVQFVEIRYAALASYPGLRRVGPEDGRAAVLKGNLLIGPL